MSFGSREDADRACQEMTDANVDGRQIRCDHAGNNGGHNAGNKAGT